MNFLPLESAPPEAVCLPTRIRTIACYKVILETLTIKHVVEGIHGMYNRNEIHNKGELPLKS